MSPGEEGGRVIPAREWYEQRLRQHVLERRSGGRSKSPGMHRAEEKRGQVILERSVTPRSEGPGFCAESLDLTR